MCAMRDAVDPTLLLAEARRRLARLPDLLDAMLADVDDQTARRRPAPDEWAPVEIVCHLRDEETDDFGSRLRAVLAGGPPFTRIDPPGWAVERRYREQRVGEALNAVKTRRRDSLDWLATIDPAMLHHALPLGARGPLSGLDLLAAWAAHDGLHVQQLAATLTRLWADRWAGLRVAYAGDIPYPPSSAAPSS
jgi:DinB family protein